jgi:hypothetical protein
MKCVFDHIRDGLFRDTTTVKPTVPSLESLRSSEWSREFETLMRNRLVMGALRYGLLMATGKPKYDRIDSAIKRLRKYQDTGNDEHLVDVANMMLLEFVEGCHPTKHFSSVDDGEHVNKTNVNS